jgi:hypothetical protein
MTNRMWDSSWSNHVWNFRQHWVTGFQGKNVMFRQLVPAGRKNIRGLWSSWYFLTLEEADVATVRKAGLNCGHELISAHKSHGLAPASSLNLLIHHWIDDHLGTTFPSLYRFPYAHHMHQPPLQKSLKRWSCQSFRLHQDSNQEKGTRLTPTRVMPPLTCELSNTIDVHSPNSVICDTVPLQRILKGPWFNVTPAVFYIEQSSAYPIHGFAEMVSILTALKLLK